MLKVGDIALYTFTWGAKLYVRVEDTTGLANSFKTFEGTVIKKIGEIDKYNVGDYRDGWVADKFEKIKLNSNENFKLKRS